MNAVRFIRFHLVVFVCALCKRAHSAASADVSLRGAVSQVNSTNANEWATNSSMKLADATIGAGSGSVSNAAQRQFLGKTHSNFGAKFIFNTDVQASTRANGQYALRSKSSALELKSVGLNYFLPANENIAFTRGGNGFVFKYRGGGYVNCDHSFSEDLLSIRLYDCYHNVPKCDDSWLFSASLSAKILHVDSKQQDVYEQCEVTITTDVTPYIQTVKLSSHMGEVNLDCTGDCSIEATKMKHTSFGIYGQSAIVKANI